MKSALFERFEILMTLEQAQGASHQGRCDEDVAALRADPAIRAQLARIPDDKLRDELREYGAWDAGELLDRSANEGRIVWIAAGNIVEEEAVGTVK